MTSQLTETQRGESKRKEANALLAAYHARDMLDAVHDILEIGLRRLR